MKLKHFLIVLFIFFLEAVDAQQRQLDSLHTLIKQHPSQDEKYLDLLNQISYIEASMSPKDGIATAESAIALAQKLNNQKELAKAYNLKGFNLINIGRLKESIEIIEKASAINTSIKNYNGLAHDYVYTAYALVLLGDLENSKVTINKAIAICEETKNSNGLAETYYFTGLLFEGSSDYNESGKYYNKAIAISKETNNEKILAYALSGIGWVYGEMSQPDSSLQYLNQAKTINERTGDLFGLQNDYNTLGNIYWARADYKKALEWYLKSLRISEQREDESMQSLVLSNIGNIHNSMGDDYESALKYGEKAYNLSIACGYKLIIIGSLIDMGDAYMGKNDFGKALQNYSEALPVAKKLNNKYRLCDVYYSFGEAYFQSENYKLAMENIKMSIQITKENNIPVDYAYCLLFYATIISKAPAEILKESGIDPAQRIEKAIELNLEGLQTGKEKKLLDIQKNALENLSSLYERKNDLMNSIFYLKQYMVVKDSILNKENSRAINNLQIEYETEKKEQQIALLNKDKKIQHQEISRQKTTRNAFIGGFVLVLLLVGVTYNRYRLKQKSNEQLSQTLNELKNTQQQLVKSEKMAAFGVMASRVAHEIQNPLNFVNNFSELSEDLIQDIISSKDEKERKESEKSLLQNIQKINHHGKRADSIVKQLQEHSRAGTAQEYFEPEKP